MVLATLCALALVLAILTLALEQCRGLRSSLDDLGDRQQHLDGLRGLCALLVAAHHAVYLLGVADNNAWLLVPADHVLQTMGRTAVAMFFMICAFLFWSKQTRQADWSWSDVAALMRNRIARIVPAYVFAVVFIMVFVGLGGNGFRFAQGFAETLVQSARALTFTFFGSPHFNGSPAAFVALDVSWSLRYEWLFYLVLAFCGFLPRGRYRPVLLVAFLVLNIFWWQARWIEYFAYGALACELTRMPRLALLLSNRAGTAVSIGLFVGVNAFAREGMLMSGLGPALLAASFLPIAAGSSWGGLLRLDALRLVGAASYSLYLLNTPVMFLLSGIFYSHSRNLPAVVITEVIYLLAAVCFSVLIYRLVERPFLPHRSTQTGATRAPSPADGHVAAQSQIAKESVA